MKLGQPKVLFIASAFPPIVGGSAHVYANLCRELGTDAVVLTARNSYADGNELPGWTAWDMEQSFPVYRVDLLRPQYRPKPRTIAHSAYRYFFEDRIIEAKVIARANEIVRKHNINVICLGELYSLHKIGQALRRRLRLPVIHYVHGEEITAVPPARRYVAGAFAALKAAQSIVAVSSFTREQVMSRCKVPDCKIRVITNGVDVRRFQPGGRSARILDRHALHGHKILLTVGRLERRKGQDMTIQAMPQILREVPEAVYLVVGNGSQRDFLKQEAVRCGVAGRVIFATEVPSSELADYYRTSDVFVMPNRTMPNGDTEGFGLVFLEAGACGRPVIGGNAGGVPDAIIDGGNGLLVDGSSAGSVADACVRLLKDSCLAQRLAEAGLRRAGRSTWQEKAQEFRRLCAEVAV